MKANEIITIEEMTSLQRKSGLAPRTWKLCDNTRLNQIRDEVWNEVVKLRYVDGKTCKPDLYIFKSANRWGEARYFRDGPFNVVGINRIFLKDPEAAKETIVHEMAHICSKGDNHGYIWKTKGHNIGKIYGIDMSRADDAESLGLDYHLMDYHVICPRCHKIEHWPEISNVWKHPERYICGICGHAGLERYDPATETNNQ